MDTSKLLAFGLMVVGAIAFVAALWIAFALILSLADYIPSSVR